MDDNGGGHFGQVCSHWLDVQVDFALELPQFAKISSFKQSPNTSHNTASLAATAVCADPRSSEASNSTLLYRDGKLTFCDGQYGGACPHQRGQGQLAREPNSCALAHQGTGPAA